MSCFWENSFIFIFLPKKKRIPSELDVLCENISLVSRRVVQRLNELGATNVTAEFKTPETNDPRFRNLEISVNKKRLVTLWFPDSAASYNEIEFHGFTKEDPPNPDVQLAHRTIRIGSIETMMLYFYYFYYLERYPSYQTEHLYGIISFLMDKYLNGRDNTGIWKRFSLKCYGVPLRKQNILLKRKKKYRILVKNKNVTSKEYQWLFLKYEPWGNHITRRRPRTTRRQLPH